MAIIKHQSSKNADYNSVLEYYSYKHEESQKTGHYEPKLDENGLKQERENYSVAYINADGKEDEPEKWAAACMRTNIHHRKNLAEGDRKSHEYIISHPSSDREKLSMEDLIAEGKAFIRENLQGYDCLMAVHRDTDNDHIHISFNSVRAREREEQEWMMKNRDGQTLQCEMKAGGKHQDSPLLRRHLNDWLKEYTRQHGLKVKDNNAKADENRAKRHGDKNEEMKTALLSEAEHCKSLKELQSRLKEKYNMELKIRGNTLSIQHPEAKKAVRLKKLGVEAVDLTRRMQGEKYQYTPEKAQEQRQQQGGRGRKKYATKEEAELANMGRMNWRLQSQLDQAQGTRYAAEDKARYFEEKRQQQAQEPTRSQARKRTKGPER